MLLEEFVQRTGFEPSQNDYCIIEQQYMKFEGDKDQFCEKWIKENGIQQVYDDKINLINELQSQIEDLETVNERLKNELEMSQGWKLTDKAGTNMSQNDYLDLSKSVIEIAGEPGYLMPDHAKAKINEITGMEIDRIILIYAVETYEINFQKRLRIKDKFTRCPYFFSTDWNYFRFNCNGWSWEIVNGELYQYNC